ncbi:MAG: dihydropteroate synthase [Thermodesulfovibrio sp.]|nr:dihydropteroate synthase [Thermodesulfovibrio sp.]
MKLTWSHYNLDFDKKTHIMGILNITPDSFSDGGMHFDPAKAVDHALRMVDEGADIIDIGGESTRPGSDPVPLEEELRRTIPVIRAIAQRISIPLSIDTYKAEVAKQALEAGAAIVNDISGLRFDPEMPKTIAAFRVPVVVMHIKGTPRDMQINPSYDALIPEIIEYLRECIAIATRAGISEEMLILDPGIGFGKTFEHNLQIINRLSEFKALGKLLLVGPSRKAFIGKILDNAPASERLEGTAAAVTASILNGAHIVRVHDVKEMARVTKVADAIKREKLEP